LYATLPDFNGVRNIEYIERIRLQTSRERVFVSKGTQPSDGNYLLKRLSIVLRLLWALGIKQDENEKKNVLSQLF